MNDEKLGKSIAMEMKCAIHLNIFGKISDA